MECGNGPGGKEQTNKRGNILFLKGLYHESHMGLILLTDKLNGKMQSKILDSQKTLKGHGNEADFLGFLQKSVRQTVGSLHYISSHSDLGFVFAEIFVIEKRLPDSPSRGVDKNA